MQKIRIPSRLVPEGRIAAAAHFPCGEQKAPAPFFKLCLPTGIDSGNFIASLLQKNGKFLYLLFMGCL